MFKKKVRCQLMCNMLSFVGKRPYTHICLQKICLKRHRYTNAHTKSENSGCLWSYLGGWESRMRQLHTAFLLYFQILSDVNMLSIQEMKYFKFEKILFNKTKRKIPIIQLKNEQSQEQEVSLKRKNTNG